ncbi:MAG: TrmH family RNA methyltransferase, partial [Actinomycetes bacterium]
GADRAPVPGLPELVARSCRLAVLEGINDHANLGTGRVAWLLGTEGPGLPAEALGAADLAVRIPMAPEVDSLNVATAAAIAFATVRGADNVF